MKEVDAIVEELIANPIGLWTGTDREKEVECGYLRLLRPSYERTVRDVTAAVPKEASIIEFGAYLGVVSETLATMGYDVTASDHPKSSRKWKNAKFLPQDLAQDFSNPLFRFVAHEWYFDCAILCETLEHLPFNPVNLLHNVRTILKPDGLLYLSVPNVVSLRNRWLLMRGQSFHNPISDFIEQTKPDSLMDVGIHWREYTMREVKTLLWECGFRVEWSRYFDLVSPERGAAFRMAKRLLLAAFPALSSTVVVMARKT